MSIESKLSYLNDTKSQIGQAIANKNIPVSNSDSFRSYADKISKIGEWQPESDWWDIESILENDTENYPGKIIYLIDNTSDTTTFPNITGFMQSVSKIKTSDGGLYENFTLSFTHTWDTTKDKECSQGYKTRYIILYFNTTDTIQTDWGDYTSFGDTLNIIFKGMNLKFTGDQYNNRIMGKLVKTQKIKFLDVNLIWQNIRFSSEYLEKLELVNTTVTQTNSLLQTFNGMFFLKNADDLLNNIEYSNLNILTQAFSDNYKLESIPFIDTSNVTSFANCFSRCISLKEIHSLDFYSATNVSNMFANCYSLENIKYINSIKISGLNFSDCKLLKHDTLIRILNALHDYSDSDEVHTLIIGARNLAKLTEEEKAIATLKGWTLA